MIEIKNVTEQLNKCPNIVQPANVTTPGIANVTNYVNISNLSVDNWVYGNISSSEYYIRMFKFITANNVTTCPSTAPFVLANSSSCQPCNSPTPLYDANLMKCIADCPAGTALNLVLKTCVSTANITCQYPGQEYD